MTSSLSSYDQEVNYVPALMSNRSYLLATNYYEAMLRFWSANQAIYILSTQVYTYSAGNAFEIHKQTIDFMKAQEDANNAWHEFTGSLMGTIKLFVENQYSTNYPIPVTILFQDGLTITGGIVMDADYMVHLGGLPAGTQIFLDGSGYYVNTDNRVYKCLAPDTGMPIPSTDNYNQLYQQSVKYLD